MKTASVLVPAVVLMVVLCTAVVVPAVEAVTCSPVQLAPCAGAIMGSQAPSQGCCNKLKEQTPCLCRYMKDPTLQPYVNSPNARSVATRCGVSTPRCQ